MKDIFTKLSARIVQNFRSFDWLAGEHKHQAGAAEIIRDDMSLYVEAHGRLIEEQANLTDRARHLASEMAALNKASATLQQRFAQSVERIGVLVAKFLEDGQLEEEARMELASLATLMINREVFMNDSRELTKLLSRIEPDVLAESLQKLAKKRRKHRDDLAKILKNTANGPET